MTGLVLVLCGIGIGLLIGATLFAGPPANMERARRTSVSPPPGWVPPSASLAPTRYVPAPTPPPPVRNGGIGNVKN